MKKYKFHYQEDMLDVEEVLTEEEIFELFWNIWYTRIWTVETNNTLGIRDLPLALQRQKCIEDYITTHNGYEV